MILRFQLNAQPSARTAAFALVLFAPFVLITAVCVPVVQATPATTGTATASVPWEEAIGLQAMADGVIDPDARLFDSPDYQRQLLLSGPEEGGFVLVLREQTVLRLPAEAVAWSANGELRPDLAKAVPAGEFEVVEGEMSFEADDRLWLIRPQPPMVGEVSFAELKKNKPDYLHLASKVVPDAAAVKTLQSVQGETKIVAFFGTWCLICKKHLPAFLKTIETVNNPKISVEYYGVTEDHLEPRSALERYQVSATPSFVVLQGGKEIGRITEEPHESMAEDLAFILAGK